MASNLISPLTKKVVRDTFGIIDPTTGEQYKDIYRSFLQLRYISESDLKQGFLIESELRSQRLYILHVDNKTRKAIKLDGERTCLVSFQCRTQDGDFAFARLYDSHIGKIS